MYEDGFTPIPQFDYAPYNKKGMFILRDIVEGNNMFLQIIPYILIQKDDRYLAYKRLNKAGEPRLRGCYSLGFGGHINETDESADIILTGMKRELEEELSCKVLKTECIGVIQDKKSSTNDHAGIVFLIHCEDAAVKETEKYEPCWMTRSDLEENFLKFEGWGRYLIDWICNK